MQYVKSDSKIVVFIKGKPYTVLKEDVKYNMLSSMIMSNDNEDTIEEMLNKKIELRKNISKLGLQINDKLEIFYKDKLIPKDISLVVNNFCNLYTDYQDDDTFTALEQFTINLLDNPNYDNIEDLYSFLQKGDLPITSDGCFMAYKIVRSDFKDKRTGLMDNTPGKIVYMNIKDCDLDRKNTCSRGLHYCSKSYISSFYSTGDKIVEVKINPKHVTSIPLYYNQAKGRCHMYNVTREINPGDLEGIGVVKVSNEPVKSQESFYDKQIKKATQPALDGLTCAEVKKCSRCNQVLPVTNFSKDKHNKTGYRSSCKQCDKKNRG